MQRRSVDYYRDQLLALLPQGLAWPREPDTNLYATLEAYAVVLAAFQNRLCDLREEADPRTTSEGLAEWETDYGLPDPCAGEVQTTAGRKARLLAAVYARGGADAEYFERLSALMGFDVSIRDDFEPPRAGDARAGDHLWTEDSVYVWQVSAPSSSIEIARASEAVAGDPCWYWANEPLECAIRRRRPRHSAVFFTYAEPPNDYGLITEAVDLVIDYGTITTPHTEARDYGEV